MLFHINDGTVSVGGQMVLKHIDFEIRGTEKIAVVGRNGAGKTTLLRLLAGELFLDRDDKRNGPGVTVSRNVTIGMLSQTALDGISHTVEKEIMLACESANSGVGGDTVGFCEDGAVGDGDGFCEADVVGDTGECRESGMGGNIDECRESGGIYEAFSRERFEYEREFDRLFTGLGFSLADKKKSIAEFSGGERTKIALVRLLMEKPDILLLDEPTNHLDMETVEWLEHYMRQYPKAVVMVSHDRFFLDRTADVVYELSGGRLYRYPGNYTHYRQQKLKNITLGMKAWERQQEEIKRLEDLIERFKHKPKKAAFARSRKKIIERMEKVEKPESDDVRLFTGEISPLISGSKWVFECEHLKIGYDRPLMELALRIRRGQKIGILGPNGAGKTTFLKTVAGLIPALSGKQSLGNMTTIGYFDQHSAAIHSDKTVAEHFHDLFPSLTEKEVRQTLGAYLFGGKNASKRVDALSGGEKARLVLAELLQSRPNFLILDEPTNHMDIAAKETLESAFKAYTGTVLFVSHDRYFIQQVAESVLIFENGAAMYYPFGYEHYVERKFRESLGIPMSVQMRAEEQALIAGMRAVPKAERHSLREISADEAYFDWQLRLSGEQLAAAKERVERLWDELVAAYEAWMTSEAFWDPDRDCGADDGREHAAGRMDDDGPVQGDSRGPAEGRDDDGRVPDDSRQPAVDGHAAAYERLLLLYKDALSLWQEQCLQWYDIYVAASERD